MIHALKKLITHPLSVEANADGSAGFAAHRRIIESKPFLKQIYSDWYTECRYAFERLGSVSGPMVEVGSGAGFLERFVPGVIKTDAVANPFVNRVMSAEEFDFGKEELSMVFVVNVLHHMANPEEFLIRAERSLKPGGRMVVIEPNRTFLLRFVARTMDHYEYWDDKIADWRNPLTRGMEGANLAMGWVIFQRDRQKFQQMFPNLRIDRVSYNNFLLYFLSGGVSFRSFLPGFTLPLINLLESTVRPLGPHLCSGMAIHLIKTPL